MMKTTIRAALVSILAGTAVFGEPDHVDAQRTLRDVKGRFFEIANWSLEGTAGYGNIGRLLLQDVGDRQRELNPTGQFSWGFGAAVVVLERTEVRLGFTRVTGNLAYDDDTGDDGSFLDVDDLGDIGASILTIEAGRFLFAHQGRFSPYARAGFAIAWWGLDDESGEFLENGTETRLGGSGALGLQYRVTRQVAVRVEAATFRGRNPFTGKSSFRTTDGFTIDEPASISANVYRAVISVGLGRPRPFDRER